MTQIRKYNLGEIASKLGLELIGDNFCQISGIGTLLNAVSGELSFLSNPSYTSQVAKTKASAVIIEERYAKFCPWYETHQIFEICVSGADYWTSDI